ncbi:MAG TPA: DUF1232 domain-containing protein [Acidimicrobiales bacterium]|nr:DUF1232 domain-containing protein [Acidimicrobiales bacterium]
MRVVVGAVIALAFTWVLFLLALALLRPRGMSLREAQQLVPDTVRMLRDIARDPDVPAGARRRLGLLVAYLALPFDVVPDFIPVLGYADDVIVIAVVLRSVVRAAGDEILQRHWSGTGEGLALVRRLAGVR